MYITTSRKPSVLTKRLCRLLEKLIPLALYENRGKKSVGEIVERVGALGKGRACVVHELHGNPAKIVFMKIGGKEGWGWLSPEIVLKRFKSAKVVQKKYAVLDVFGEKKGVLLELLKPLESEDAAADEEAGEGAKVFLEAGAERIVFSDAKKRELLSLEVDYHEGTG